jgi:flagellar basal-body rod protein FlgC
MGMFDTINISATGLTAEKFRINVISQNLANVDTTRTKNGGPYKRKVPIFAERFINHGIDEKPDGVQVVGIYQDKAPDRLVYDPHNPDADKNGYVHYPNVDAVREMVDMITAQRAYDANASVINSVKAMIQSALKIGK